VPYSAPIQRTGTEFSEILLIHGALPLVALFRTRSAAVYGIDAHMIDVEVDMYPAGTNREIITVGMPDTAVKESRERIKSALINSGFHYPSSSITVNLAPANVKKEGAGFDLPMATAILGAMGRVTNTEAHLLVRELSLDGSLRPIRGALSIAVCAQQGGYSQPAGSGGKCRGSCGGA
jgi:magnesium chelatase family protein